MEIATTLGHYGGAVNYGHGHGHGSVSGSISSSTSALVDLCLICAKALDEDRERADRSARIVFFGRSALLLRWLFVPFWCRDRLGQSYHSRLLNYSPGH